MKWMCRMGLVALAACGSRSETEHDRVIYVRHDGADMMVWVRGNVASDVMLVVVHGGPGGESTTYIEDLHSLEADYAIAYWDQRASGASRGQFAYDRFAYPQFGADLRAVVDALDFAYAPEDVFVMGHSFGVEVGTEFVVAGDNQDRISGWMPVNGTHSIAAHGNAACWYIRTRVDEIEAHPDSYDTSELDTWRSWRSACEGSPFSMPIDRPAFDEVWERSLSLPVLPLEAQPYDPLYPDAYTSPYSGRLGAKNDWIVYTPMNAAYTDYDRSAELADVTLPVQLMWGAWDNIIPLPVGEAYHDLLGTPEADKRLVVFDQAYHSPMYDQQTEFLEQTRVFLETYRQ